MHRVPKILFILLTIGVLNFGCDKNNDIITKNYFKIGDVEYDMNIGILENYGEDPWHDGFYADVTLFSDGFTLEPTSTGYELVGKGNALFFEMISTVGSELDNGVYRFSSANPLPVQTFRDGAFVVNFDIATVTYDEKEQIVDGKVTVEKNGNKYNISIDCKASNGEPVQGYFSGILTYYDYTKDKSAKKSLKRKMFKKY